MDDGTRRPELVRDCVVLNHCEQLVATLDTERIRDGAARLLAEVGMAVPSENARQRLAAAGLRITDGRVFIPHERAVQFMERQRAKAAPEPEEAPLRLHPGSHTFYHFDPEARTVKRLTLRDLERYTKLVAALRRDGVLASAYCVGQPSNTEPQLAPLWQQFTAARFIPDPPLYAYSPDYAPFVSEMARILGKRVGVGVHPISPLTLGGEEFELALRLMDEGTLESTGTAGMPVMGVTAPLDWVAGWAQAVAEAVGAAVALEALGAKRVSTFAALYAADMRTGGLVFASPEHVLLTLTEAKVNREVLGNLRRPAKALYTTAKTPSAQAAAEKTAHTVVALLAGYRHLGSIGIMAVDEVFSPQQVFIDLDIVGHAWRIVRGMDANHAQGDVVALVREGVSQVEHFLAAPTTLARFRDFYWSPSLFDRQPTAAWLANPTDVLDAAWARGRELIDGYTYELDADRQRAFRKVIDDARRHFCP